MVYYANKFRIHHNLLDLEEYVLAFGDSENFLEDVLVDVAHRGQELNVDGRLEVVVESAWIFGPTLDTDIARFLALARVERLLTKLTF